MKRLLVAFVVLGGVAYYAFNFSSVEEYVKPEVIKEVVEVETEIPSDEVRIQAAQDAARAKIEAKAQAAYDDMYQLEMDMIEAEVLKAIEDEIKARRIEVEKKTGVY